MKAKLRNIKKGFISIEILQEKLYTPALEEHFKEDHNTFKLITSLPNCNSNRIELR